RPTRSRRESCRACGAGASPPTPRAPRAARGTRRPGALGVPSSRPPPSSPASTILQELGLERVSRSGGSLISPFQRRDVQMDRHQIIDQDRPRRARAHGGDPFQISLARLADLDSPRLLFLLGRQVGEVVVMGLVVDYATI